MSRSQSELVIPTPTLLTGCHLAFISDIFYPKDSNGASILIGGFKCAVIKYSAEDLFICQPYIMDAGSKQKKFMDVMLNAKVEKQEGKPYDKKNIIDKQLWICVQQIHNVNNEHLVLENGIPKIEYRVFQTFGISEGVEPKLKGDPRLNNSIASGQFKTYINISEPYYEPQKEESIPTFE